jgi:hypothetical protein
MLHTNTSAKTPFRSILLIQEFARLVVNRPALGVVPPGNWAAILEGSLMRVAPKGLAQV